MSGINPLLGGTAAQSTASSSGADAGSTTGTSFGEDFQSFIQLLTAQVQNQDPLSPMDSTQFVEQLATFSSLEQQVLSNGHLESIATMIGDLHSAITSEWLGQKVSVETTSVPFDGEPVEFTADLPEGTDEAVLTVTNSAGEPLWTQSLAPDADTYRWSGETLTGATAPNDVYQFRIDHFRNGTPTGAVAPRVITTVTDVASENGQVRLGTDSHLTADLTSVRRVD